MYCPSIQSQFLINVATAAAIVAMLTTPTTVTAATTATATAPTTTTLKTRTGATSPATSTSAAPTTPTSSTASAQVVKSTIVQSTNTTPGAYATATSVRLFMLHAFSPFKNIHVSLMIQVINSNIYPLA